eukprot:SAG11_NODE_12735_length_687_cov_2.894558_1_plen_70_part_10
MLTSFITRARHDVCTTKCTIVNSHSVFDFTYLYGFYSKPRFSFHAGGADDGGIRFYPSDRSLDKTLALKL